MFGDACISRLEMELKGRVQGETDIVWWSGSVVLFMNKMIFMRD